LNLGALILVDTLDDEITDAKDATHIRPQAREKRGLEL
jgi:hypothetical protein